MAKKPTAQCACGSIKFEFDTDPTFIAVCHCLDCKKASGGEAATFFCVPEEDFTLISGKLKARSAAWTTRTASNRCSRC